MVIRNFSWMLFSKMVAMGGGLLTGALINRALGPAGRGIYAEMQTWVALFVMLFGCSMDSVIYHFSNREIYPIDDNSKFVTIISLTLFFSIISSLCLTLIILFRPNLVSTTTAKFILLLDILIIVTMFTNNLIIFFQAIGNIKLAAIVGIAQNISYLILISLTYIYFTLSLHLIILSLIIMQLVAITILLILSYKSDFVFGTFSGKMSKNMIAAGLKLHIATIATFVYTKINQLIVLGYCGKREAGLFAVALTMAMAIMVIPQTLQIVLYPRIIHSKDDYEVTIKSLRVGFYGWGLLVFFIILLAKPILYIYGGDKFLSSINTFRVLMIAVWFLPLSSFMAPYIIKVGAFYIMSASAVILGFISIGLNMALIPRFSALGAALATSFTCLIGFGLSLILLWYVTKNNPLAFLKLKGDV